MTIHKNMFPEAVALQLNDHKTLPCTNVSAHSYYLRKLRTNLFGIYCANEETIHCFFYDLLNKMKTKHGRFDQLTILCDNSQGQFKEYFSFFFFSWLPGEKGTVSEKSSQFSFKRTFILDVRQAILLYTEVFWHSGKGSVTTRMGSIAEEQSFKKISRNIGQL